MGTLHARLVGRDLLSGDYLGTLPTPLEASAQLPRHAQAVCTLSYPIDGVRDNLVAREGSVWALEVADSDGDWVEPPNARFYTSQTGDDQLARVRVWQVSGVHVGWRLLHGEVVGREGIVNDDGYRVISAATPGQILRELISTARSRTAESGLPWAPSLELNFDAVVDSAGNPWTTTQTLTLPVQRYIGEVLDDLVADLSIEYEWRGMELYVTGPGGLARDLSAGRNPSVLRPFHVTEAPRTSTIVDSCTDVDFAGDEGFHARFGEPDSYAPLGRLVKPVSQGQTTTYATARRRADVVLREGREPRIQTSRAGSNATGGPLPLLDVRPGDIIRLDTPHGDPAPVVGATVTFGARETRWHWTLGTMLDTQLARIRKKAELALAGAGVIGGDGTAPRPPGPDTRVPRQVVGLVAAPDTYIAADGLAVGRVVLGWSAVTHATDDTAIERLGGYEVWARTSGEAHARLTATVAGDATSVEVDGLVPGSSWEYQVRAFTDQMVHGAFSALVTVTIDDDLEPPYRPTAPLLSSTAGTVTIRWDGLGVGTAAPDPLPMPPDLARVQVWSYGTDPANAPEYLGALTGTTDGDMIIDTGIRSGQVYYYALTAVDRSGNASGSSDVGSVMGRSVADDPEIVNELGAQLVADSAWIGTLTSVLVTADMFRGKRFELTDGGLFASGPADSARWELSETGLAEYDAENRKMASWEPGYGIRLMNPSGQVVTELSTQNYGLSVRNPANGVLTPATSVIFGGAMNQSGSPADWLAYGLYPNQVSPWIESDKAADTFTWNHAGSRAVVWFSFEAYSTLNGVNPPINMVQKAFRIYRVSDNALVYDSSGNLNGTSAPPGIPYANDQDQAYFQGMLFCAFNLAPGAYRFMPIYRVGSGTSGGGIGYTSIRQRSVAIAQW